MIKNIILFLILLIFGIIIFLYGVMPKTFISTYQFKPDKEALQVKPKPEGGYFLIYEGERVWINRSFREHSLSGGFRGRGPHAGK